MKVALLTGIIPKRQYDYIIERSIGVIQYAADALQKSFIEGLSYHYKNLVVLNLPFIGSWPQRYKSWLSTASFKESQSLGECNYELKNYRFLNITGVKMLSRYLVAKRAIRYYCKNNKNENKVLLIYSVHTPFLKAAVDAKHNEHNLQIILIVPDLPEYMGGNNKGIYSIIRNYNHKLLNKLYDKVDGYVLLSEYMKERLIRTNQPYTVVEGIFNQKDVPAIATDAINDKKVIMYSGTLSRRYNVMNLVNAVQSLHRNDFILEIYGDGDTREEIEDIAKTDERIKYCGQKSRAYILKRQTEVDLLVNPRTPNGEYTRFSFPSKTMEYLASGTATLLYQLPGIPQEYYNYCFSIPKDSNRTLAEWIDDTLNKDISELIKTGENARTFILDRKNPIRQTYKVVNLINSLR